MASNPASAKVASLDRARFDRLASALADAETRVACAKVDLAAFCKAYSLAHRTVVLTPEQVKRDMDSRGEG